MRLRCQLGGGLLALVLSAGMVASCVAESAETGDGQENGRNPGHDEDPPPAGQTERGGGVQEPGEEGNKGDWQETD